MIWKWAGWSSRAALLAAVSLLLGSMWGAGTSAAQPQGPDAGGGYAHSHTQPNGSTNGHTIAGRPAGTDLTKLPIGDGKYSTTTPAVGYVYSCQSYSGSSSSSSYPWMNGDGTFNLTAKVNVSGSVSWTSSFSATVSGKSRIISGNGLPNHTTGTFPISSSDTASLYDKNPNTISSQTDSATLLASPSEATSPSCLSGGAIGIMTSGAVIYDALDAEGRDALANEVQDSCGGHPEVTGEYHYHSLSSCISDDGSGHSDLLGYALDGFGIYGNRGESGESLTDDDLDECHGHTHSITWDGQTVTMYHYHITYEFPYTLGCYRGKATSLSSSTGRGSTSSTRTPSGTTTPSASGTRSAGSGTPSASGTRTTGGSGTPAANETHTAGGQGGQGGQGQQGGSGTPSASGTRTAGEGPGGPGGQPGGSGTPAAGGTPRSGGQSGQGPQGGQSGTSGGQGAQGGRGGEGGQGGGPGGGGG